MQLIVQDVTCHRGGRVVFQGLSFAVEAGSGLVLEGPNGAGKSSLLRMLAGLLPPAAGRIALSGGAEGETLSERCHFIGHLNGIKRSFTAAENVRFWAAYLGGQEDTGRCLDRLGLAALADIPAALFSAGQARRLALARLLAAPRPLWLLDEPSVSLDAASRDLLAGLIEEHVAGGGLVVAATHVDLGVGFKARLALGAGRGP